MTADHEGGEVAENVEGSRESWEREWDRTSGGRAGGFGGIGGRGRSWARSSITREEVSKQFTRGRERRNEPGSLVSHHRFVNFRRTVTCFPLCSHR